MYFLFDIGGTKMRFAVSVDNQTLGEVIIVPTPEDVADVSEEFKKVADKLLGDKIPTAVAGGITRKKIAAAEEIQKMFTCPVFLENDAALAGLGEAVSGAGRGKDIVVYITVSTGVGGARIVNAQIDRHLSSFEPGHQIIDFKEPAKHLEDYVSGSAVSRLTGQNPREITDEAFWKDLSRTLALGLHNSILHWTPEIVVLGGSMMKKPGIDLEEVRACLEKSLSGWAIKPELKRAELGDQSGLYGALTFLKQKSVL